MLQAINHGTTAATNVTVTDTLPAGVTFVGIGSIIPPVPSCSLSAGVVTCALGTIAGGSGRFIEIKVTAPNVAGTITNVATVAASEPDPNPANNESQLDTPVGGADLMVALPTFPPIGDDEVVYRPSVFNLSDEASESTVLTVRLPSVYTLASYSFTTGSGTCSRRLPRPSRAISAPSRWALARAWNCRPPPLLRLTSPSTLGSQ